jgi:PAS domain S-box-containing protein
MSSDSPPRGEKTRFGDGDRASDERRVLLFMQPGRDRDLLLETLGERYEVETTTDVMTLETEFDCCVFDAHEFNRVAGTVQPRRDTSTPVFLPFVLLIGDGASDETVGKAWEYVDDVIELPVRKSVLLARIDNLVERRRTAIRLARRERQLEQTVEDLTLKEQAMDAAPVGITIAEPSEGDDPLVYANEQFESLTGYDSDVIGHDCRFLQGEETDPETRATIRAALDAREPVSVDILNYRKSGQRFWNKLDLAPIREDGNGDGEDEEAGTHFVGFQTDITERKIRERRLEVLNRVLSHNLRNKMNVIEGHLALLGDEFDSGEAPDSLVAARQATSGLLELAAAVQKIEQTMDAASAETVIAVDDRLRQLMSGFEDRCPDVVFDLTLPNTSCEVSAAGLVTAIEEAIENAVEHNDADEPHVAIRVESREGWVDIEIEDNGSGIPDQEIAVLEAGETPLRHASRLGLWLIYWIVGKAGGRFSVSDAEPSGACVSLSVPAYSRE